MFTYFDLRHEQGTFQQFNKTFIFVISMGLEYKLVDQNYFKKTEQSKNDIQIRGCH